MTNPKKRQLDPELNTAYMREYRERGLPGTVAARRQARVRARSLRILAAENPKKYDVIYRREMQKELNG